MSVTITPVRVLTFRQTNGTPYKQGLFDITFDSTYPSGGETVDLSAYYQTIESVMVTEYSAFGSGVVFDIDKTNYGVGTFTIEVNVSAAHTHILYLANAAVADGATTRVNAGTNLLGANTSANISVAGIAAASGAAGGIVTAAQSNLAENTTADIATLTCQVNVWGY